MPWQEVSTMALRQEFVTLAQQEGANIRALCRAYGISPKTGYKWLERYQAAGAAGLTDGSRRPRSSPRRTPEALEAQVLALRAEHPAWGGRKLARWLQDHGVPDVPAPSTITAILRRHDRLDPVVTAQHTPWQRFEHATPNALWQVDFKGPVALGAGVCHPLSVLDDHSRFLVGLLACPDQTEATVRAHLTLLFQRYGLPWRILTDNGSPWGTAGHEGVSALEVWLLRLDVPLSHGRAYHPQTQGKVERFHGTFAAELGRDWHSPDLDHSQATFDTWRDSYNLERPHEALDLAVPASRYQPSSRPFPVVLPPLVYAPEALLRRVQADGTISYQNQVYRVGKGLRGQRIELRHTTTADQLRVYLGSYALGALDLQDGARTLRRLPHPVVC